MKSESFKKGKKVSSEKQAKTKAPKKTKVSFIYAFLFKSHCMLVPLLFPPIKPITLYTHPSLSGYG